MRQVPGETLWIGHIGDTRDVRSVLSAGIQAVVDLAANEAVVPFPREIIYCRFPLVDGSGNPPWLLRCAIEALAGLLRASTPTLVYCSLGMSRSPIIASAALSLARGRSPGECLATVLQDGKGDISPALWQEVQVVLRA